MLMAVKQLKFDFCKEKLRFVQLKRISLEFELQKGGL